MIRMSGMIDLPAIGMNKSVYDEVIKTTESSLGLTEAGEGEPHKPGDTWKNNSGRWSGKNSDGYVRSFDDQSAAQKHASGSEQDVHDPKWKDQNAQVAARNKGKSPYAPSYDKTKYAFAPRSNENTTMKTEARKTIESLLRSPRLRTMVKEEYVKILDEVKEAAPKIEKKLEDMRSKMCEDFARKEYKGTFFEASGEKRIQINLVAELLDVPVNELMLYFLNEVKTTNQRQLVEYRLGHVYFYAS